MAKSLQSLNLSPMFTPPNTAVDVDPTRWHMTYLAWVGTRRGAKVTTPGNSAASAVNRSAHVSVPSHHLVNWEMTEQSREQSTRTPRRAARRMLRSTRSVLSPGSRTYTENSTRSPAAVRSISSQMHATTSS